MGLLTGRRAQLVDNLAQGDFFSVVQIVCVTDGQSLHPLVAERPGKLTIDPVNRQQEVDHRLPGWVATLIRCVKYIDQRRFMCANQIDVTL